MSLAERVREYARTAYIEPARKRRDPTVQILAGDVAAALHIRNRTPVVCQALGGRKFLAQNNLELERLDVPPEAGLGRKAVFKYKLNNQLSVRPRLTDLLALEGIGKKVFAELGGGEEFLRREREEFYGPGKDPLLR